MLRARFTHKDGDITASWHLDLCHVLFWSASCNWCTVFCLVAYRNIFDNHLFMALNITEYITVK